MSGSDAADGRPGEQDPAGGPTTRADVLVVHGIWNRQRGMTPGQAAAGLAGAAREHLARGLAGAGLDHVPPPSVAMAYYAHLLGDEPPPESVPDRAYVRAWLAAAGAPEPEEQQAALLAPVRQALGLLVRQRAGGGVLERVRKETTERLSRLVLAFVQDTDAYTSRPERRRAVRDLVAEAVRDSGARVVVAHSLGSVVAYETLHAHPDLEVDLLVTLGSPLGLPALMRKLEPEPHGGRGARPPGVGRWVNIADIGDLVALPPRLTGAYPVDTDVVTDIGLLDPHTLGGYLANGLTAAALAPYLPS
ncbi:hypothetical protein ABT160_10085 [Streptomyces sp. NPDC001941]|uniref:hypothetical protein n=1 Tax=Streptomyces sp. NPDC001941 TaxID=3154659 RepID=UPI003334047F